MLHWLGGQAILFVGEAGRMGLFLGRAVAGAFKPPFRLSLLVEQINALGVRSLVVILLTGAFTGMVLALQGYNLLRSFGSEAMLGSGVALGLVTELGPVLSALMVTGRGGSAMSAELGLMRVSEQIDALDSMNLPPMGFLVSPRLTASVICLPLLGAIFVIIGIIGSHLVAVEMLGANPTIFFEGMVNSVGLDDLFKGLLKTLIFGATIGLVCSYKGFNAGHGAQGVGKATTEAVVLSSVLILMWNYVLTSLML